MPKKSEFSPANLYEFKPKENISSVEVLELANLIRVGIPGDVYKLASENLRKHFVLLDKKVA